MAVRQVQLSPEAEPIESFLDEMETSSSEELIRQRDRSVREFRDGLAVSWEKVKLKNGL